MSENDLVERALKGDLQAFNDLVLMYQELAFNLAYRMLGSDAAAADATQEAVISMYRKLESYRGGSFKSWFLRIVSNECLDELRKMKRHPSLSIDQENEEGDINESSVWLRDEGLSHEEHLGNQELEKALTHCLNNLDEKFKSVILLIDVSGENYETVASVVKVPIGTIKSRLARARQKMQECLQGFGELLPERFRLKSEDFDE
ncbi:MAG: sigma-70 family RNA polymerase sigma factor [Anaerolineaceae bacterium]|nr:sigma-70 family RNA polymerase sigma factor [Anaerolineaceae bacterium]